RERVIQRTDPLCLNRPTVAPAPDRAAARGGSGHRMDVRWSRRRDSNPDPAFYTPAALPMELRRRDGQGLTAEDRFRRRGMIWPAAGTGQALGVRGLRALGAGRDDGLDDGSPRSEGASGAGGVCV